ncbi:MAG: hypothetical protein RLZZ210_670 [Pseudomonadota bacterium]
MTNNLNINTIAVLGAGTMGSQIALELAKYGYKIFLFDNSKELATSGKQKIINSISAKEITNNKPSIELYNSISANIIECSYDDDLHKLKECNLIIEAIIEQIPAKQSLYEKIRRYLNENAILATNTSGLSIQALSKFSHNPEQFCGLHFFNPPKHLSLVEYIPTSQINDSINSKCDWILQEFKSKNMHFNFITVKDSPNFIGNRIGFFAWLVAVHSSIEFNLEIDIADALSGVLIGRAKSATYRTADIVGLDVVNHVINTMQTIQDSKFEKWYKTPDILNYLIENKHLGQKSKKGFYTRNENGDILCVDIKLNIKNMQSIDYISIDSDLNNVIDKSTLDILQNINLSLSNKITQLQSINHNHAKFVVQIVNVVREYIEYHKNEIAYNGKDIIDVMKNGFGWKEL